MFFFVWNAFFETRFWKRVFWNAFHTFLKRVFWNAFVKFLRNMETRFSKRVVWLKRVSKNVFERTCLQKTRFTERVSKKFFFCLRFKKCVSKIVFPKMRFKKCVSKNAFQKTNVFQRTRFNQKTRFNFLKRVFWNALFETRFLKRVAFFETRVLKRVFHGQELLKVRHSRRQVNHNMGKSA